MRPVGTELFHADGQTNITQLIVAFRNFANAPKNKVNCHMLLCILTGTHHSSFLESLPYNHWAENLQ
jgi:hypothetical protein